MLWFGDFLIFKKRHSISGRSLIISQTKKKIFNDVSFNKLKQIDVVCIPMLKNI
jgi:hypothetical protein